MIVLFIFLLNIYSILIVNTHGFITNIGEILFYDILKIVDPDYINFLY